MGRPRIWAARTTPSDLLHLNRASEARGGHLFGDGTGANESQPPPIVFGMYATPPKVFRLPKFPNLAEDNIRKRFLRDAQYKKLIAYCPDLWFRTLVEVGRTYGWRISELINLQVKQVDADERTIRLEPGTTKNKDGREVTMPTAVHIYWRNAWRGNP